MNDNQNISESDLAFIRQLEDFDLTMLISEIHDHGWPKSKRTLEEIRRYYRNRKRNEESK